jgi:hypothetical protein
MGNSAGDKAPALSLYGSPQGFLIGGVVPDYFLKISLI